MQQLFYKQILGVIFGYVAYIIFGNIFKLTYFFYNIFQKSGIISFASIWNRCSRCCGSTSITSRRS